MPPNSGAKGKQAALGFTDVNSEISDTPDLSGDKYLPGGVTTEAGQSGLSVTSGSGLGRQCAGAIPDATALSVPEFCAGWSPRNMGRLQTAATSVQALGHQGFVGNAKRRQALLTCSDAPLSVPSDVSALLPACG
ncbi:Hypothetical predicted protein [Olea europaea subsp. europaea]|uniref:Uncharacterized protein n=1 Tax=Olea europaea subsp. europaea TaxID=158383 RepID=A0A8S0SEQ4_OLEEU|nr:Hypothetical predicted protein [Olea europaea subsp. europaea]